MYEDRDIFGEVRRFFLGAAPKLLWVAASGFRKLMKNLKANDATRVFSVAKLRVYIDDHQGWEKE